MAPPPPRRLLLLVAVLALATFLLEPAATAGAATSGPAPAGETSTVVTVTTTPPLPKGVGHAILPPNYGHKPTNPGDRGGWEQSMLFWLVLVGVTLVVLLAWRSSRRARRIQTDGRPT